ncbi:MAG: hypothetical protein JWR19_898 [Pedosphaera sp.]|nr:hypothetical protein [Pedosphaera sp.]
MRKKIAWIIGISFTLLALVILLLVCTRPGPPARIAKVQLADGRIIQVEGVSYGKTHSIGSMRSEVLRRLQPWLPLRVEQYLAPKYPRNEFDFGRSALVVWVNAVDPIGGTNVDCQQMRVEFVDEQGDLYGETTSYWFGGQDFWRAGHVFESFPRTGQKLTLQITPWRTNQTSRLELANPHVTVPEEWSGKSLPQEQRMGELSIILSQLNRETNGSPNQRWETRTVYWKPEWELRQGGKKAEGWQAPEWTAEDPTGNRGQFPGVHQPVLRYSVTFYPSPTNREAALLVGTLPEIQLTNLTTITWWNQTVKLESGEVVVLGLFPPGTHVFCEGVYQTNPPVTMGPVSGGARSGWVGQTMRVSPVKEMHYTGHYTPDPVIYLHTPEPGSKNRLAVRFRDESGRYWLTEAESQGVANGIQPYMIKLPPEVTQVVPEVVVLKPIEAEFLVSTPGE